jgi:transcriptional regulator with XRE-family HTH domain
MAKYKPKPFYPPLAEDFILVRHVACLSQKNVATLLHVTRKTVENWESGQTTIPYAAFKLLRIMTNYELPGKEWEGWSIRGGALFNPSGRQYQSHELFYIGNIFQMARYWIADREKAREVEKQLNRAPLERQHLRLIQGGKR